MDIKTYKEAAWRTSARLATYKDDAYHMIFGMVTEVGELADVFKRNLAYKKPIDLINVQEEIGDLMWYIINFCTINGFELEDILYQNIEKLRARYPEKYTEYDALNRDLEKERKVLEGQKQ